MTTYADTHRSKLNAGLVSFADAELARALEKLKTHPIVQAAGVYDLAGVIRAATELDMTDWNELPRAWQHWHDQTLSPDAIRAAIGKPWAQHGAELKGFVEDQGEVDPDLEANQEFERELIRRKTEYRLAPTKTLTGTETWDDVEAAANSAVQSAAAYETSDAPRELTTAPAWDDVEAAAGSSPSE